MKKLGFLILVCVLACGAALIGCKPKDPPITTALEITSASVLIEGSGTKADPYYTDTQIDGTLDFAVTLTSTGDDSQNISVTYSDANGTSKDASDVLDITASSQRAFSVKGKAVGTDYIAVKSEDGRADTIVEIKVTPARVTVMTPQTPVYTTYDYYERDAQGNIVTAEPGSSNTTPDGKKLRVTDKKHAFTGEILAGQTEQIRNIYKDYHNGFAAVSVADKANPSSPLYRADYAFVGIQGTTLNATHGELVSNKENFQVLNLISSSSSVENLDCLDKVRYYKNMLYANIDVESTVTDKTIRVKYYSDALLRHEIPASQSPIVYSVKTDTAGEASQLVSFTAPGSGSVWAKFYCGTDEDQYCVIKSEILPTYGSGVQVSDYNAKEAADADECGFVPGNNAAFNERNMKTWNVAFLQTTEKFQVKTFYEAIAGGNAITVTGRFETFTNMGLPAYAVLKEDNTDDLLKRQYMLPFDFEEAYAGVWNKVNLAANAASVEFKAGSTNSDNDIDFRIRLCDPDTKEEFTTAWNVQSGLDVRTITASVPASMRGKTVLVTLEARNTNPAYNKDSKMTMYGFQVK